MLKDMQNSILVYAHLVTGTAFREKELDLMNANRIHLRNPAPRRE